jgi:hypothetical protein
MVDQHTDPDEIDPLEEQVRNEPNPELVRQHDGDQDPLGEAIIKDLERAEESDAIGAEEADGLDPSPVVDDA